MWTGLVAAAVLALLKGLSALAGHLWSSNTFPQPLPEKEEAEWLRRLKQGDEKAREILVERNLRLVAHICKKFDNTGEDVDDLISIGTLGLIKAIKTFDPGKGTRLATYAARCIENEILMHLRATKRSRTEVSLYDPIGVDREGNEISLIDVLPDTADEIAEQVGKKFQARSLWSQLKNLTPKERQVLEMRYGLLSGIRKTQREIARMLGISRSYVSRIEKKAVSKLGKDMSGWEG